MGEAPYAKLEAGEWGKSATLALIDCKEEARSPCGGRVALWFFLSASVILLNKHILSYAGFDFPIALVLIHMGFSSIACFALVLLGVAEAAPIPSSLYWRMVVPIGALFSVVLVLGNAAYLFLSISFIQMLKALQPVILFAVGVAFGTEEFSFSTVVNISMIGAGVVIATWGQISFALTGLLLQTLSVVAESVRLNLVQILQRSEAKASPFSLLYHMGPWCFAFLVIPFLCFEAPALAQSSLDYTSLVPLFVISALATFGLNITVLSLIRKNSPLAVKLVGGVKDWLLIVLSVSLGLSYETAVSLMGYGVSFFGMFWYHSRIQNEKWS